MNDPANLVHAKDGFRQGIFLGIAIGIYIGMITIPQLLWVFGGIIYPALAD
jgi:hypothetical protein